MIQDIYPSRLDNSFRRMQPSDCPEKSFAVYFRDGRILADISGSDVTFPRVSEFTENTEMIYLFSVDDEAFFLVRGNDDIEIKNGSFACYTTRELRDKCSGKYLFAAFTAFHLAKWYEENRFCGKCGGPLREDGICPNCDKTDKQQNRNGKSGKSIIPLIVISVIAVILIAVLFIFVLPGNKKSAGRGARPLNVGFRRLLGGNLGGRSLLLDGSCGEGGLLVCGDVLETVCYVYAGTGGAGGEGCDDGDYDDESNEAPGDFLEDVCGLADTEGLVAGHEVAGHSAALAVLKQHDCDEQDGCENDEHG